MISVFLILNIFIESIFDGRVDEIEDLSCFTWVFGLVFRVRVEDSCVLNPLSVWSFLRLLLVLYGGVFIRYNRIPSKNSTSFNSSSSFLRDHS